MDREFLIHLERLFTDFSGVGGVHTLTLVEIG
jgi:hypothetical protein